MGEQQSLAQALVCRLPRLLLLMLPLLLLPSLDHAAFFSP